MAAETAPFPVTLQLFCLLNKRFNPVRSNSSNLEYSGHGGAKNVVLHIIKVINAHGMFQSAAIHKQEYKIGNIN